MKAQEKEHLYFAKDGPEEKDVEKVLVEGCGKVGDGDLRHESLLNKGNSHEEEDRQADGAHDRKRSEKLRVIVLANVSPEVNTVVVVNRNALVCNRRVSNVGRFPDSANVAAP